MRVGELQLRTEQQLSEEIDNLANLRSRFGEILLDRRMQRQTCADALERIGVQVFSKDHDWRTIFMGLLASPQSLERHLELALATYQNYLSARSTICTAFMAQKRATADIQSAAIVSAAPMLETGVFNADEYLAEVQEHSLQRLPQGEAVCLRLADGAIIPIVLARHQFSLAHERDWTLIADDGQRFSLREGVNSIGRSQDNDIPLGAGFRNVSRHHLVARTLGKDALELTDVSSYGTYIPPAAIAS